jgi:hypothetical protein
MNKYELGDIVLYDTGDHSSPWWYNVSIVETILENVNVCDNNKLWGFLNNYCFKSFYKNETYKKYEYILASGDRVKEDSIKRLLGNINDHVDKDKTDDESDDDCQSLNNFLDLDKGVFSIKDVLECVSEMPNDLIKRIKNGEYDDFK